MLTNKYSEDKVIRIKRALVLCFISCLLCAAYLFGAIARSGIAFETLVTLPKFLVITWKGVSEVLLVFAVWISAQSRIAHKFGLSVLMIFLADMALALEALPIAGVLFVLAHLIAAFSYISSRPLTPEKTYVKYLSFVPLLCVLVLVFFSIWTNRFQVIVLFPAFSAFAAFCAMRSSYPLALNGLGATVFWISDFIFVLAVLMSRDPTSIGWLVWLTFSSGLILVVLGFVTIEKRKSRITLTF